MRLNARLWTTVAAAPLLASCMFLLDFDELQLDKDKDKAAGGASPGGAGGTGGTGGTSVSEAGTGQGGDDCGDCDDSDPCTIDTCSAAGGAPGCLHEPFEGLALDGFETTLEAESFGRPTLVAGSNFFYLAALDVTSVGREKVPEITLYRLDSESDELETVGKFSDLPLGGKIASSAALAIEPTLGIALHAFVGVTTGLVAERPRVAHLVYINRKATANPILGSSYNTNNFWVPPQALAIGNSVKGAWLQEDGTMAVHDLATNSSTTFGDVALPATTLALLSTATDEPALLFTAEAGGLALGSYVETGGQNRSPVVECQPANGNYVSSAAIDTQISGIWLASITKGGDDYLTTGGATLVCLSNACTSQTETCKADDLGNSVRNVAGATVRFETDDPGIFYSVVTVPSLQAKPDSQTELEAALSVALARFDFSPGAGGKSTPIGATDVELARMDTDAALAFGGPDWPSVAILPTGKVALAWIQPTPEGSANELHFQRYKMCLPAN